MTFRSPYEFRKKDGVWQRRRIGTRAWKTLVVTQAAEVPPSRNRADRRNRGFQPALNRWDWT